MEYVVNKKKVVTKVEKNYSFCKSMVYTIQAITGEQTHDILSMLVEKGDELFEMHEIDITKPLSSMRYYTEKKKRSYIYYPGTKLYLGIYVGIETRQIDNYEKEKVKMNKLNTITYSFKLPQTYVKMTQKEFDDIAVDGMLTNSSFNFDEPNLKRPSTPAEKKQKEEEYRALLKAKRELKKANKKS